jgi:two-component system NarL family sensor kinase
LNTLNPDGMLKMLSLLLTVIHFTEYAASQNKQLSELDSLQAIANKTKTDKTIVDANIDICRYYLERGIYDSVNVYAQKSLLLSNSIQYEKGIGNACFYKGFSVGAFGKYDSTEMYWERTENIFTQTKDTIGLISLYNGYSILHNFKSDYSTAITYLLKAEGLLKNPQNPEFRRKQFEIYANLGFNLVAENQTEKGINYMKKASAILSAEAFKSAPRYRVTLYNHVAEAYLKIKKYTEAKNYLDSAFNDKQAPKNNFTLSMLLKTKALYYENIDSTEKALHAYKEGLSITDSTRDNKVKAEICGNVCRLYLKTGNYTEAEQYANMAVNLGKSLSLLKVTAQGYEVLKAIAAYRNDYKTAFEYSVLEKKYADSATNSETQKTTLTLEAKYQAKKKETEIAALTLSNKEKELAVLKRNRLLLTGSIVALSLLIVSVLLFRNSRQKQLIARKEQKLQQEQIAFLERQQQVVALQSMVNGQETERTRIARDLHDGLGGLFSTIKMYFSTLGHREAGLANNELFQQSFKMVDNAAVEIRRIAHNMMPEVLIKMGLSKAINELCEHNNSAGSLKIVYQESGMEERLDASTEIMLYRIVQELLNNIIKHANARNAIVQFIRDENRLSVTVEDDGKGFDVNSIETDKHTGIENIKTRVAYLNGNIQVESTRDVGTTVMMDFPLV